MWKMKIKRWLLNDRDSYLILSFNCLLSYGFFQILYIASSSFNLNGEE